MINKRTASIGGGKSASFGNGEPSKKLLKPGNCTTTNFYDNNEKSRRDFTVPGLNSSYEDMLVLRSQIIQVNMADDVGSKLQSFERSVRKETFMKCTSMLNTHVSLGESRM